MILDILPIKFQVNWPYCSKKFKIDFQACDSGRHTGFPIRTNLAIFDLQVTQILPTMFRINWPLGPGEEVKNRFLR